MNTEDILVQRLRNQLLISDEMKSVKDAVSHMGAIQAQEYTLSKWAIALRTGSSNISEIDKAINEGAIIRTHILRPTWHFVTAENLDWMIKLCRDKLYKTYVSYCKALGINEVFSNKIIPVILSALENNNHLTRSEISEKLAAGNKNIDNSITNNILFIMEIEGLICGGKSKSGKHSYALTEEWVPQNANLISKEEALAKLTTKYFQSHGPATLQDFIWWSGLSSTDAKLGISLIKDILEEINLPGKKLLMIYSKPNKNDGRNLLHLLPPYDEFIVGYKDRTDLISKENHSKVMSSFGLFKPTVMLNGKITGSWKKKKIKNSPEIELSFFDGHTNGKKLYKEEVERLIHFLFNTH